MPKSHHQREREGERERDHQGFKVEMQFKKKCVLIDVFGKVVIVSNEFQEMGHWEARSSVWTPFRESMLGRVELSVRNKNLFDSGV